MQIDDRSIRSSGGRGPPYRQCATSPAVRSITPDQIRGPSKPTEFCGRQGTTSCTTITTSLVPARVAPGRLPYQVHPWDEAGHVPASFSDDSSFFYHALPDQDVVCDKLGQLLRRPTNDDQALLG